MQVISNFNNMFKLADDIELFFCDKLSLDRVDTIRFYYLY